MTKVIPLFKLQKFAHFVDGTVLADCDEASVTWSGGWIQDDHQCKDGVTEYLLNAITTWVTGRYTAQPWSLSITIDTSGMSIELNAAYHKYKFKGESLVETLLDAYLFCCEMAIADARRPKMTSWEVS